MRKTEKSYAGWYFLGIVVIAYLIILAADPYLVWQSLIFFTSIIKKIILVFIGVFVLMFIINYLISPERLLKLFEKKAGKKRNFRGWAVAVITGIISTGPIYMWYPMLSDLREKGVKYGFIAAFLYNRAVKIPLIPMMMLYFRLKYVIVLTLVMIVMSVIQGMIINRFLEVEK